MGRLDYGADASAASSCEAGLLVSGPASRVSIYVCQLALLANSFVYVSLRLDVLPLKLGT